MIIGRGQFKKKKKEAASSQGRNFFIEYLRKENGESDAIP